MRKVLLPLAVLIVCIVALPASAKIVHRWSFATDGTDSVGGVKANPKDGAAVKDGALVLDGQANWAEVPIAKTIEKLKSTTFEAWVTWTDNAGSWSRVFDFGTGGQSNMFFTPRNVNPGEGETVNKPRFAITTNGFGEEEQLNAKEEFPVGKLTHLVVTIDAEKKVGKMYINGKEVASGEITLTPSSLGTTTNNFIGASEYEADPMFHGSISEFRVYDNALTADEVAASGKAGPDQLAGAPAAAPAAVPAAAPAMPANSTQPADAGKSAAALPGSGLIHRWTFASDLSDSVGSANGELKDGAKIEDGRLILDGKKAYAALPIGGTIEKLTNSTFETWVKWDERQGAWLRLFDFGVRGGKSMYVTPRNGGGRQGGPRGTLRFTITVAGDPGEEQANSPEQFPVGEDTHVVLTIDGDKKVAKLYLNGKLTATKEDLTLTPSSLGNTGNNWIGRSQFPDPFFKGSFAEFRIYNKVLTPEEVEADFKAGAEKAPQ